MPKRKSLSFGRRLMIAAAQKYRCAMCHDVFGPSFHIDHVVPISWGGSDILGNMQALCPNCHCAKSHRESVLRGEWGDRPVQHPLGAGVCILPVIVQRFIDEKCERSGMVQSSVVYNAFKAWHADNARAGPEPPTQRAFSLCLKRKGFVMFKRSCMFVARLRLADSRDEIAER